LAGRSSHFTSVGWMRQRRCATPTLPARWPCRREARCPAIDRSRIFKTQRLRPGGGTDACRRESPALSGLRRPTFARRTRRSGQDQVSAQSQGGGDRAPRLGLNRLGLMKASRSPRACATGLVRHAGRSFQLTKFRASSTSGAPRSRTGASVNAGALTGPSLLHGFVRTRSRGASCDEMLPWLECRGG